LKIAFVSDVIYPFVKGGAEKRIYDFSTRLARRGHEVHVFGVRWWEGAGSFEVGGVAVHGVCSPIRLYAGRKRSIVEPLAFSAALARHLAGLSFDLIDSSEFPYIPCFTSSIAARATSAPLVVTWHEVWGAYWSEYFGPLGCLGRVVERAVASLSDHCIAVSQKVKQDLLTLGVSPSHISVAPNGVDFEEVKRVHPSGRTFDIVFVGRLIPEKNLDLLLESVAILARIRPSIRCAIVGEGPESRRLNNLASRLGVSDRVLFLGTLRSHEDVISLLKAARVFVLPSSREGFSMILAEAKACGLPAIVYSGQQTAAPDMIEDGRDGFLFHTFDAKQVATLIEKLLSKETLRNEFSKRAYAAAKRYDLSQIVPELENVYRTVLDGSL